MIVIRSRKGFDLPMVGAPSLDVETLPAPKTVALLPERIPFVKPRLEVGEGDRVRIGSVLFTDKADPDLAFVSPGGGRVQRVVFGPKRVIREIVVECDEAEEAVGFEPVRGDDLDVLPRETLVRRLLEGGLWPLIRALPFRRIAPPHEEPPTIFVGLGEREPFQPDPAVYLSGKEALFRWGLSALRRLCPTVVVHATAAAGTGVEDVVTHRVLGPYPAGDAGVALYHLRRGPSENRSWYISGQDLLTVAGCLASGSLPTERVVCTGGGRAGGRRHVRTRLGAPLRDILGPEAPCGPDDRCIVGGVFRGYAASADSHLGLYDTSVSVLQEPTEREILGFVRPGFRKHSFSKTFLSRWNPGPFDPDTNRNGGRRACIACGHCASVCPVDIWPQMTYKAILADEVEEYLGLGLLDCVECGLCTYVCPSKIELAETLRDTKRSYHKELGAS